MQSKFRFLSIILLIAGMLVGNSISASPAQAATIACANGFLLNSSFENFTGQFNGYYGDPIPSDWTLSPATGAGQIGATTAFNPPDGTHVGYVINATSGSITPTLMYQSVNIIVGTTYSMTFYAGSHDPAVNPTVEMRFYNSGGTEVGTPAIYTETVDIDVTGSLGGPYQLFATAPSTAATMRVILRDPARSGAGSKADAMCLQQTVNLGNRVWIDANNNGIIDSGEVGVNGVTVQLYQDTNGNGVFDSGTDTLVGTTTTATVNGVTGTYNFTALTPSTGTANTKYIVVIPASNFTSGNPLNGYLTSSTVVGSNLSDGTPTADNKNHGTATGTLGGTGFVSSNAVNLTVTTQPDVAADTDGTNGNLSVDFGFTTPGNIGNRVWYDTNNNGIVDVGEVGINGVTVNLYQDTNGNGVFDSAIDALIATTTTATISGTTGSYNFTNLTPSNGNANQKYLVVLTASDFVSGGALSGYVPSSTVVGSNLTDGTPTVDNKNHGTASGTLGGTGFVASNAINLTPGTQPTSAQDTDGTNGNLSVDLGLYKMVISGTVFVDTNNNGTQDTGETPTGGVESGLTVRLFKDSNGNGIWDVADTVVMTTTTTTTGGYTFTGLTPGSYIVCVTQPTNWHSTIDTANQTDSDTPNTGADNNDNGHGNAMGVACSRAFTMTAGDTTTNHGNTVTNSTGTTSDATIDFGLSQSPTAIEVSGLAASLVENTVQLKWHSLTELNVIGFNVLRAKSANGAYAPVNSGLIGAKTPGQANSNRYTFTDGSVSAGQTYYYRLQVIHRDNSTDSGDAVKVTVGNVCAGKLSAPRLASPGKGDQVQAGKITFAWRAVNCAAGYEIQIRLGSANGRLIADAKNLKATQYSITKLATGRRYVWRVLACTANGNCTASAWSSFKVANKY